MPAEDYEALIAHADSPDEDTADLARIDALVAAKGRGKANPLPLEAMKRILSGEGPVRVWRDVRGMTQGELAAKAGIKPNYLSMIEGGERRGSPATLKRIAAALDVDMEELIA
ncbi:MAG: helix-turn-helix transcriptional regulator [Bauldia sp.]